MACLGTFAESISIGLAADRDRRGKTAPRSWKLDVLIFASVTGESPKIPKIKMRFFSEENALFISVFGDPVAVEFNMPLILNLQTSGHTILVGVAHHADASREAETPEDTHT